MVFFFIMACLVPLWIESGLGLHLDSSLHSEGHVVRAPVTLTHSVWADNVWLLASSLGALQQMIASLSAVLADRKLYWKDKSLKVMASTVDCCPLFPD